LHLFLFSRPGSPVQKCRVSARLGAQVNARNSPGRRIHRDMAHDTRRPDRVAEAIREEVATFLAEGVKDPRVVGLVTVTGVDITRDLRHAKVYVSILGSESERAATLDGLGSVASHLRSRIGRALRLRIAPEIAFKLDQSVAHAARIETLLAQLHDERTADATPETDERPPAGGGPSD
jgi:ribosome-binding factor A